MKLNIPYGRQEITQKDIEAVVKTLQSDWLTQGPAVAEFEQKFADYVGAQYAVAVSNGTTALHLAVKALNTKPKSKVITTPITFAASANCIRYCDAEVIFSDIDPDTLLLDILNIKQLLQTAPKGTYSGIIPVSFAGYPVDMEAYRDLANEHDLWLIEDACHAPGASFIDTKGKLQKTGNGNYADATIFSFHPVKHIACGEGGMITTNNFELYQKLRLLRTHGITKDPLQMKENHGPWYYEMKELGYNYRLGDIACSLGISQLERAEEGLDRRREIARIYNETLSDLPIRMIHPPKSIDHAFHLYIIQVEERLALYNYLQSKGIYVQVHYIPVHTMPYYQKLGWRKGDMPHAEKYYQHGLSLPMYPSLKNQELAQIINHIKEFFNENTSNNTSKRRKQKSIS